MSWHDNLVGSFEDTFEISVPIKATTIFDQWSDSPDDHGVSYIVVIKTY